jgi:DtxR family transcriptional regulator, Mn-dependent transcriptional regulator
MNSPAGNLLIFMVLSVAVFLLVSRRNWYQRIKTRSRDGDRVLIEDVLKLIFSSDSGGKAATMTSVAAALGPASAKAVDIVERMHEAGLVTVQDDSILLAEAGRRYALQIIRAHRLWEKYLADETGVDPLLWHNEAEHREHALTPEQTEALSRRLGNPNYDPHGDPIPTADGEFPVNKVERLSRLRVGEKARVVRVKDKPEAVYAQLVALSVFPDMEILVEAKNDQRIIVSSEGRQLVLAPVVAGNVSVKRLAAAESGLEDGTQAALSSLVEGEAAEVVRVSPACRGGERRRLMDLGVVPGTRIEYDNTGLTGGLTSYRVRGTVIALREEQTDMISIHNRQKVAS